MTYLSNHHGIFKPKSTNRLASYSVSSNLLVVGHGFRPIGDVATDLVSGLKRRVA